MITRDELNEDQEASFRQMTSDGGLNEVEALSLIQEFCIDKNQTGLKVTKFRFTPEGQKAANELVGKG